MNSLIKTYENGLRLVLSKNNKNVIGVNILFNVGSQNETDKELGFSHFIEHLVFKGTKKRTAEQLSDELTMLGADFNACTSRTTTRFTFKCLAENFEKCFEIYSDMLANAEFREDDINKERNVVIEEMKRVHDDPVEVLYERVMENYFSGLSYAHDELGTEEIIKNVTRDELLFYKQRFYIPKNCIISVAGNISLENLEQVVEKYFVFGDSEKSTPYQISFEKFKININKKYDVVKRNDNQANVCIHIKGITRESDVRQIAEIYTCILANSQNSRLYKKIREELGLVYSIYGFMHMGSQTGELFIFFGTRPENVELAMTEIRNEISKLADSGVTELELEMAKNLRKSNLEFMTETNSDIAELIGTELNFFGEIEPFDKKLKKLDKVSKEQVQEFAKVIFNESQFNVVAVGKNFSKSNLLKFSEKI